MLLLSTVVYFQREHLLCARLRTADGDGAAGSVEELARLVKQLRQTWPEVRIIVRGDSGFCREDLMAWCERTRWITSWGWPRMIACGRRLWRNWHRRRAAQQTGQAARVFKEFTYQTRESWARARRVVAKAEHLEKGANPALW